MYPYCLLFRFLEWYVLSFGPSERYLEFSWSTSVCKTHPRQTDASSCGVMILLYAWFMKDGKVRTMLPGGLLFAHLPLVFPPSTLPVLV